MPENIEVPRIPRSADSFASKLAAEFPMHEIDYLDALELHIRRFGALINGIEALAGFDHPPADPSHRSAYRDAYGLLELLRERIERAEAMMDAQSHAKVADVMREIDGLVA